MASHRPVARSAVHLAVGALALLLRWLTPQQAALIAGLAVVSNLLVLPRLAPFLFRSGEREAPWRSGIVLYPVTVLLLIVLFRHRLEIAGASWAILAGGDGAAGLFGRWLGSHPVPWNRTKSLEGSVAFVLAAFLAAWGTLVWLGRSPLEGALLAAPTSLFGAFMESLPWRLDDNLTVPFLSAIFLAGLTRIDPQRLVDQGPSLRESLLVGILLNVVLAFLFRSSGAVDRSGMVAGFVVGVLTFTFAGAGGFSVLLTFFVLGSASTRLGMRRKVRLGIAQEKKGARSARHALANCGVAVFLGLLVAGARSPEVFVLAYVCAYATAAFDTVSSEIGRAYGRHPVLITTFRRVPPGTDGGVSWIGTLAGVLASAAVGGMAVATGFLSGGAIGIVLLAAIVGSTADSLLGATLERRGLIDNEAVNFSNTLIGALTGLGLAGLG